MHTPHLYKADGTAHKCAFRPLPCLGQHACAEVDRCQALHLVPVVAREVEAGADGNFQD